MNNNDLTAALSDNTESDSVLNAHVVSLRLMFSAWMSHFRSLGYVKDTTMDMLDRTVCKQSVERSVKDAKVRCVSYYVNKGRVAPEHSSR